jgi:hypothetical protein
MMRRIQRLSSRVCTAVLCAGLCAGADLASAKVSYEKKDYTAAFADLAPLAQQGNPDAQLILGKMYLMGQGVSKNEAQAMKWFKASGAQSNAEAQFFVGSMYLLPHKDVGEGLRWLRLSAEQGNQDAQLILGKGYLQGSPELPRDPVQAEMWLRLAAKDNLPFYGSQLASAEKQMSREQIAKGAILASEWRAQSGLKP